MSEINKVGGSYNNFTTDNVSKNISDSGGDFMKGIDDSVTGNMEELKNESPEFFLNMMKEMQAETRAFEAVTNTLKARDDAAKTAIRNIK